MGGMLRNQQQSEVSLQRRMPVDNINSDALSSVSGEAVQFYYFNSGVATIDAGQAAGTVVVAKLANRNILGAMGDVVGSYGDTSFAFGTGTVLTSLKQFNAIAAEDSERNGENKLMTLSEKAIAVTAGFVNGEFSIDHRTGMIYGLKATTGVADTGTYKVLISVSGGGGGIASDIQGNVADDAVDAGNPVAIGGLAKSSQKAAVNDGDRVKSVFNLFGEKVVAGFNWVNGWLMVNEQDPLDQHYENTDLVDTTNISAATHYYPASTGDTMDGYQDQSITGKFIDADGTLTLTLEVSNDEDSASADWNSVYFYDDANNSTVNGLTVTNNTLLISASANNNNFRRYRWAVVASGATNTVILKERKKAL